VKLSGESALADHVAVDPYPKILKKLIEEKGYRAKQVFNADESTIFLEKKCPQEHLSARKSVVHLAQKLKRISLLSSFAGLLRAT